MSFLHTREAGTIVSRCNLCGHVIRARMDRDIYLAQRAHDWLTCQLRRAQTAQALRVIEPEDDDIETCRNGHPRAGNTSTIVAQTVCLACQRERWAATKEHAESCVSPRINTDLGVSREKMDSSETAPSVTSKPFLDTPVRGASK